MAQINYTTIDDNAVRSVTAPNTFYTAYNTASTAITGANFANEGLDERSIAANTVTDGRDAVFYDGVVIAGVASAGAYTTLVLGAKTFSLNNGGAGWTVGEDIGAVRIRFQASFFWTYTATPQTSETLSFRISCQEDGGAFTAIANSVRYFQSQDQQANGIFGGHYYDNFKFGWVLPYTADGASHTLNAVRIEYQTSAAVGFSFSRATLQAVRFIRAGVY